MSIAGHRLINSLTSNELNASSEGYLCFALLPKIILAMPPSLFSKCGMAYQLVLTTIDLCVSFNCLAD